MNLKVTVLYKLLLICKMYQKMTSSKIHECKNKINYTTNLRSEYDAEQWIDHWFHYFLCCQQIVDSFRRQRIINILWLGKWAFLL